MLYLKTKYPQMYLKTRTIMSRKVNWNLFATSHSTSKTFGILHQATDSLIHSITQNHEQQINNNATKRLLSPFVSCLFAFIYSILLSS